MRLESLVDEAVLLVILEVFLDGSLQPAVEIEVSKEPVVVEGDLFEVS